LQKQILSAAQLERFGLIPGLRKKCILRIWNGHDFSQDDERRPMPTPQ
jgi:hypothetical protein